MMPSSVSGSSTPRRAGARYGGRAGDRRPLRGAVADSDWAHEHSSHKQRLLHQRSQVDTSPPESAAFSRPAQARARPDQAARTAEIQTENRRLLQQLDSIERRGGGAWAGSGASSSRQDRNRATSAQRRRQAEQDRIAKENMQLLRRLQTARPTYSREKQLEDFRRSEAVGCRIARYERRLDATRSADNSRTAGARAAPSPARSRFRSVSAYTAVLTDSDTESEDGWLAVASSVMERQQPVSGDVMSVEKEVEVKNRMDDAKKLRKALGALQGVLKKSMKSCQGLGMTSDDTLAKVDAAASAAPTCTDRAVSAWARSATSSIGAFRDSGAFLRFQSAIYNQMVHELYPVKDHAKAVYVLGKERRDARDKCMRAASQPVDVGSETAYKAAKDTLRAFTELDAQFADDFRSLREHYSSQLGLSLQVVLLQSADYFDGIAAAMRRASCFKDEPWYATVEAATRKPQTTKGVGARVSSASSSPSRYAIPQPPSAVSGGGAARGPSHTTSRASGESARALYSRRSRGSALSGSTAASHTHTVAIDASASASRVVDGETWHTRHARPAPPHTVTTTDRLRIKPDPELPPPSPHRQSDEDARDVDVTRRLRVKPAPELPPPDKAAASSAVDDRLLVKPRRAPPATAEVRLVGVPVQAAGEGEGGEGGVAALPEAERVEESAAEKGVDAVATGASYGAVRPAPSAESQSRVRQTLLKKGFSDYLRVLGGDDTSEWGLHPKA